jgi:hypothetical protein
MLIGYKKRPIAAPLIERVSALKEDSSVRIVDVLCAYRNHEGIVETEPIADLLPEDADDPGSIIDKLLTSADASRMVQKSPDTGRGFLFLGNLLPDFRVGVPRDSGVLALLIEHRWAVPLRDTVTEQGAYPVGDGWMGRDALRDVGLLPPDRGPEGALRAS